MNDRVELSVDGGVAHVTLVRADKMNAIDGAMFTAIAEVGEKLSNDSSVRVVVLSGEGRAFCAGLDMSNFANMASGKRSVDTGGEDEGDSGGKSSLATRSHGIGNLPQHAAWLWRELPVPVIAALHGVSFGGGFQLALGADMRYAAPGTRFSVMEIKWGLVPDMAGTQLMRHLVRDDVVRDLTYSGRIFEADEALQLGLITRICEHPLAQALATARQIADRNPDAIRAAKRLLNEAKVISPAEGLLMESREQDSIIGTPNQIEAVLAEMEKRSPRFTG